MYRIHSQKKYTISSFAKLAVFLISIFLSIPAIIGIAEDPSERIKMEKRELEPYPAYSLLLSDTTLFFSKLEKYINDHFGLSIFLNSINKKIQFNLFKTSPAVNVSIGKGGFVFLNSHNPNNSNTVLKELCITQGNASNFSNIHKVWKSILEDMTARGYRSTLAIVPSKPVLYPENLPNTTPKNLRDACLQYREKENLIFKLKNESRNQNWSIFYPYKKFYNERFNKNFFPKENFHWKGESTHLFTIELLKNSGIAMPPSYSMYKSNIRTFSDMENIIGFRRFINIQDYNYSQFETATLMRHPESVHEYYNRASDFRETKTISPISDRKLLIISNSFGAEIVRHISPAYKSVVQININHLQENELDDFFHHFVESLSSDDIIFLFQDAAIEHFGKKIYSYLSDTNSH